MLTLFLSQSCANQVQPEAIQSAPTLEIPELSLLDHEGLFREGMSISELMRAMQQLESQEAAFYESRKKRFEYRKSQAQQFVDEATKERDALALKRKELAIQLNKLKQSTLEAQAHNGNSSEPKVYFAPTPRYPLKAEQQRVSGYAIVAFTITSIGTTKNIVLVEEYPTGYDFGYSAIKAATRLKYNRVMREGRPVEVEGVTYKFSFNIAQ